MTGHRVAFITPALEQARFVCQLETALVWLGRTDAPGSTWRRPHVAPPVFSPARGCASSAPATRPRTARHRQCFAAACPASPVSSSARNSAARPFHRVSLPSRSRRSVRALVDFEDLDRQLSGLAGERRGSGSRLLQAAPAQDCAARRPAAMALSGVTGKCAWRNERVTLPAA